MVSFLCRTGGWRAAVPRERMLAPVAMATGWLVLHGGAVDAKRWASRVEAGGSAAAEVLTDFKVPEVGEGRRVRIPLFFQR